MPSLLAFNVAPSATFLNQALALMLWGVFAAACGLELRVLPDQRRTATHSLLLPGLVLALLTVAAVLSPFLGSQPRSLALSAVGTLLAAAVLLAAGARAGAADAVVSQRAFTWFAVAWVMAGLLNVAIGLVQTFVPQWADGEWIARSTLAGRAIGNLRQPNHVCTLLLWAAIAALVLLELRRLSGRATAWVLALLALGLVQTASRTALLGVLMLAAWGLMDRRLSLAGRRALWALPVLYGAAWAGMALWARVTHAAFGGQQRLAEADLSASRFGIWADSLTLIRDYPLTGVGFGEFNFAWSLSVMPQRPVAFFDHAHNLLLHWAVELGLPASAVLMLLLSAALWQMFRGVGRLHRSALQAAPAAATWPGAPPDGPLSLTLRAALVLLLMMALHSQLEYPLWYAYFLLPTAWVLGFGLAKAASLPAAARSKQPSLARRPRRAAPVLVLAGLACALGAVGAVADYTRVAAVFDADSPLPLQERLARGQRSWLFAHHANYAVATVSREPAQELDALRSASHYLLDTRLMTAWARAYADSGDLPRAQYLAARLREFRNPLSAEFFAPCQTGAGTADAARGTPADITLPFQCRPPDAQVMLNWTHFR